MKKILIIIVTLLVSIFCGCSKEKEIPEAANETESKSSNEFYDCGISMNTRIFGDFIIDNDQVYFNVLENKENGRCLLSHCVGNIFSNNLFQYIDLCFEYNCEVFYTIKENVSGENTLCLLKIDFDEGKYIIEEYRGEGVTQNIMAIPRDTLSGEQMISYAVKNDGTALILTNKKLYYFVILDSKTSSFASRIRFPLITFTFLSSKSSSSPNIEYGTEIPLLRLRL